MKLLRHSLFTILILCVFATSANADLYLLSGTMDPQQAGTNGGFGGGTGNGDGKIFGLYDDSTNLLDYTVTYNNLTSTVTNAHFHRGAPGQSGGVELGIPGPYTSGVSTATGVSLTAANETNLLAGNWYANIHTAAFPGGEIRGQVFVMSVPEPATATLGLFAMVGLVLRRRR